MVEHLLPGAHDVARRDRAPDRAMLDERLLRAPRDEKDAHQRAPHDVADGLHAVQQQPVAGRLGDGEMEAQVGVDEVGRASARAERRVHLGDRRVHLGEIRLGAALRRERRGLAIEDAP